MWGNNFRPVMKERKSNSKKLKMNLIQIETLLKERKRMNVKEGRKKMNVKEERKGM